LLLAIFCIRARAFRTVLTALAAWRVRHASRAQGAGGLFCGRTDF
jgi:hypothetical protein